MRETLISLSYLLASGCFVMSLKWLSHPTTARRGVRIGEIGMAVAIVATLMQPEIVEFQWIALALVLGTALGIPLGLLVPMTAVPQRTALSHAFGALAAGLVGVAEQAVHRVDARGEVLELDALQVALEAAEALDKAHQKHIIHRDLKPANVMLTPDGHAKVMDFGLAKQSLHEGDLSQEATRSSLTEAGLTVGTLAYMSPEQIRGEPLTPQSDLFSLGIVLYEMLTGAHPFKKPLGTDTAHAIVHEIPAPVSARSEVAAREVQGLLDTLLAKRPADRGSAHEARSRLAHLLQESGAEPVSLAKTLLSRSRRVMARPWFALPAVALIAGALYLGYQRLERGRKGQWARDVAVPEIARLTDAGNVSEAFDLAAEANELVDGWHG